jgi:CRISPR/Cas system-associated exonuclease Cas4 (RecB family)
MNNYWEKKRLKCAVKLKGISINIGKCYVEISRTVYLKRVLSQDGEAYFTIEQNYILLLLLLLLLASVV